MNDRQLTETILSRRQVYSGVIINVEHWQVELSNGAPAMREIAVNNGASAVVPVDADGNVYLVRQFRCPPEAILMELPAGKLDHPGEDRLTAAKRELSEETGFTAAKWTKLTDLLTTPAFCSDEISLFLAQELTAGSAHTDENEFLNLVKMPIADAKAAVMRGEIRDGKTVTGILMACNVLGI